MLQDPTHSLQETKAKMPPPAPDPKKQYPKREKGKLIKGGAQNTRRALAREVKQEDQAKRARLLDLEVIPDSSKIILGETKALLARGHNRMNVAAHVRVAELNHDPIAFAVKVIKGEALTQSHPLLAYLYEKAAEVREAIENKSEIGIEDFIGDLLEAAVPMLTDSWTPPKLRLDANKDLLKYLFPTLKAVDHSGTVNHNHTHIALLQAQEVEVFRDKFNDEY